MHGMRSSIRAMLNRFPYLRWLLKNLLNRLLVIARVSSYYVHLQPGEKDQEFSRLRDAWQSPDLPARQREVVDTQLEAYRRGEPVEVFDVITSALQALPCYERGMSVLEVGCSSGYYSEVFEITGLQVQYTGCDYSDAFIKLARQKYPSLRFDIEDATSLNYEDNAFDIVISGCCLLHIPEYGKAVAETARVARRYVIFHRTPVLLGHPNVYYRKKAYGVEMVEIHFNEPQFLKLLADQGLELNATFSIDESDQVKLGPANRTYVCRKISS